MHTHPENIWPAAAFLAHVERATAEDCAPQLGLDRQGMRNLYLSMWLELAIPAGNA